MNINGHAKKQQNKFTKKKNSTKKFLKSIVEYAWSFLTLMSLKPKTKILKLYYQNNTLTIDLQ